METISVLRLTVGTKKKSVISINIYPLPIIVSVKILNAINDKNNLVCR